MELDDLNSVIIDDLQCDTGYNFTVVVNTTTFINESNTASIHLECTPSTTPCPTPTSVMSTETPQSKCIGM